MEHSIVYKENERYCSFPHVARLPDQKLALVFRKASKFSYDAAINGTATHHDPNSSIEIIFSSDEGLTWGESKTIYNTQYGVNDPAITVLESGKMLVRFVALNITCSENYHDLGHKIFSHRTEHGLVTNVIGNIVMSSSDLGETWNEIGLDSIDTLGPSCSRDPIVECDDGTLLMPVYTGAPQRSDECWVLRSFNGGVTWGTPTKIASDPEGLQSQLHGVNYNECSVVNLSKGHFVGLIRGDSSFHTSNKEFMPVGGVGQLYLVHSFDSGMSWTKPMDTGIFGQPGALVKLSSGNLLATYGYRKSPFGVRACVLSTKDWKWGKEIVILDDANTWDCGYPFSIELAPGKILSVYYNVDEFGVRHIQSSKWDL